MEDTAVTSTPLTKSAEIRRQLGHPVIDSDGHIIEVVPVWVDYMKQVGGSDVVKKLEAYRARRGWADMTFEERQDTRTTLTTWWLTPTLNTRDHATASLPGLLAERMEEFGFDFSVLYPTYGLGSTAHPDAEFRRVLCRSLNMYVSEMYGPYAARMTPAASIPMHTPQEAIEELEYAVNTLGLKTAMIAGHVRRPVPAIQRQFPELPPPHGIWFDTFGADSAYDYDPFWAKCVELGVSIATHTAGFGFATNATTTNFMQNHLGHFSAAGHMLCKSLYFGGVTHRFPELRVAFLEGGVGWATDMFAGIIGRWEKRNVDALRHVDPSRLDADGVVALFGSHGEPRMMEKLEEIKENLIQPTLFSFNKHPENLDDWSLTQATKPEDIRDRFIPNFFFGCEADDRMNEVAFNTRVNPLGVRLNAMLSSDIGHWDVPDMAEVMEEAYEVVEQGLMTAEDFRDFSFANPVRFFAGMNQDFFKGTAVEAEATKVLA